MNDRPNNRHGKQRSDKAGDRSKGRPNNRFGDKPRGKFDGPQRSRDGDNDRRPRREDNDRRERKFSDRPPRTFSDKRRSDENVPPKDIRMERAEELITELNEKIPGLGARRAALDVMMLMRKGRTLDQALAQCRSFKALEGSDRSFAFNLINTTMRRRGALDEIIGKYLDRPLPEKSMEVQDILRLATCQLVLLDTPPHAGVGTSVELAGQKRETAGYKGLVNAVTRKIAEKGKVQLEKLAPRVDTPGWLWRAWERAYGAPTVREIAKAHLAKAPLDISLKPDADATKLLEIEGAVSLAPNHVRMEADKIVQHLPGYDEGDWWVQDLAASLPVRLLGDVSGKMVYDLCAAPGGKTMQLAAAGANVHAIDISGLRLKKIVENLQRTKLHAKTIKADILEWEAEEKVDAILLDAPCSATGTIRRNPDVIWTRTEDEVRALAKLQAQFIDKALEALNPGGTLIYCVCSLQKQEGEDQVKAALSRHEGLSVDPITSAEVSDISGIITRDGYLRTLPHHLGAKGGLDGFFACRFIKG